MRKYLHQPIMYSSHTRLSQICTKLRKERNLLQIELIRKSKQLHRLNTVLSLHKHLMVLLSQNNVLQIKELVSVALLSILLKANKLPSTYFAYRMAKNLHSLHSPVSATEAECLKNNLNVDYFASSYATSLKMDESFFTARLGL